MTFAEIDGHNQMKPVTSKFMPIDTDHATAIAAKNKGGRPRTGTAYNKDGIIVVSIRLNRDAPRQRFTFRCPARADGDVIDLPFARSVASRLQAQYDNRTWDPFVHGVPVSVGANGTISDGVTERTVMTIVRTALGLLPPKTRVSILSDALMRELPALDAAMANMKTR